MALEICDKYNILILSRGFRAGDAITTLNLFSQWPKENLFCASLVESEYAKNLKDFYLLGDKEITYAFPFNRISRPECSHRGYKPATVHVQKKTSLKKKIYEKIVRPVLQRLDLYETRFSLSISAEFEEWVNEIKPTLVYTSIGDIPMAKFILEFHKKFPDIKIVVHGFDDWLTPTYKIVNESKHRDISESLFKKTLEIASGFLTSSEKMAKEYRARYGLNFTCFPNPIRIANLSDEICKNRTANVVFTGKVGWHNHTALRDMMQAVEKINSKGQQLFLDIYTDTPTEQIEGLLGKIMPSTRLHKPIPNSEIPSILAAAAIVYLPISIDRNTARFTRYSMSTKMGEYLSSGTPMIYYGPEDIAMTDFLRDKYCVHLITKRGQERLIYALKDILSHDNMEEIETAKALAYQYFNIEIVSPKFRDRIIEICTQNR